MAKNYLHMALIALEESQSDKEKQQGEANREMEIVAIIRKTGTVIVSITVLCQVVAAVVFWWHARKVKPINWLPRFIMLLAAIQGIYNSSFYISSVFFKKPFPPSVRFWMGIVQSITHPTIMGLLIRFERVQVQLRAQ